MDPVSKARLEESKPDTKFQAGNPHRFSAGISGNPSGRPKAAPFTLLCKKLMRSKVGRALVKEVMSDVLAKRGMAAVLLLREIAERTDGKVTQSIAVNSPVQEMTDEQLASMLVKIDDELVGRCERMLAENNEQPATTTEQSG